MTDDQTNQPDPTPAETPADPDSDDGGPQDEATEPDPAPEADPLAADQLPDDVRRRIEFDNEADRRRNANVVDRDGAARAQQQRVIDAARVTELEAELEAAKRRAAE